MDQKELAEKVNELIISWSLNEEKIIIAIDGYTGVGKTTLVENLKNLNENILIVHRDDFLLPRKTTKQKLLEAEDKSKVFELEICDNDKIQDFLQTFKDTNESYGIDTYDSISGEVDIKKTFDFSKKILIIEGVFMFHPLLPFSKLWDKRIYLSGDRNKINERRVAREKIKWGENYVPEDRPDSYFKLVTTALDRYMNLYHPEKIADEVFNVE